MLQFALLAFFLQVNQPSYQITESIQVMQEKLTVQAASLEEDKFIPYQIDLDTDIQKYIWELCVEFEVEFELMLGIAFNESRFNPSLTSYDNSSRGLFQMNTSNTFPEEVALNKIVNPNPFNPYHSSLTAVSHVKRLTDKYRDEGYKGENLTKRVLTAYRYGIGKSKRKNLNNGYVRVVLEYKHKLESGEITVSHS
ncbi:transglycosylase SLT domain-containing protein [Brevibacillus sp. NRS-1366]|uniref:transglycosylase SLT domain-containing protein n=1 Tax=Brevibacillus sp. NRS-1366 TaxID=3233899 RepID=UPI003D203870